MGFDGFRIGSSDFIYTKNFAGPRSGFYLHKLSMGGDLAGIRFYLHKEFTHGPDLRGLLIGKVIIGRFSNKKWVGGGGGAMLMKMAVFLKENGVCCGTKIFQAGQDLILCTQRISRHCGGDVDENGCFPSRKQRLLWNKKF